MEEQIKNLDARTTAIEHILPPLATKEDLRLRTEALQEDLRLSTAALQHEMTKLATKDELNAGLEDAKRYTLMLNEETRDDIPAAGGTPARDAVSAGRHGVSTGSNRRKADLKRAEVQFAKEIRRALAAQHVVTAEATA